MDAFAISLTSACKAFVFRKLTLYLHMFFYLKSFLWKDPMTVKVRKKSSIRFWASTVSVVKCVHIEVIFWHKLLRATHKSKSYIYCVNQFLREKRNKKSSQESKQKQSHLFNFCNIFHL